MSEGGDDVPKDAEEITEDPLKLLEDRIAELEKELQYAMADMSNLRQKSAKERSDAFRFGPSSLAKKILPLLGGLERALEHSEGANSKGFIEGVKMTLNGFKNALQSEGVTHIESMGEQFDPTRMEAIAMLPAPEGIASGTVIEVVEEGYMLHDRVLIASRVIVTDASDEE